MILLRVTLLLLFSQVVQADQYRPRMMIENEIQVVSSSVLLGDIARIEGSYEEFQKLIDDLKFIPIGIQLRPLESSTITGAKILDLIEQKGIPLDAFGYSIPVEIKITRNGRTVTKEDILNASKLQLHSDPDLEINVKGIEWESQQLLPEGDTRYDIERLGAPDRGKLPIRVTAYQKETVVARFLATALVDDWRSIPVIRGRLDRGSIINHHDIQIVRTNLASLPLDVALSSNEITGKRITRSLSSGDPVRRSDLDIPPIIERGKVLKMIYRSGGFTATASGIALEPGLSDEVIQVRNDRSNKVVKGKILSADEVLVLK
jgi:flagella basal body P-ring formation protein FlgA